MKVVSYIGLGSFLTGVVLFLAWIFAFLIPGNSLAEYLMELFPYLNANRLIHISTILLVCGYLIVAGVKKKSQPSGGY